MTDDDIEFVARAICEGLGRDPNDEVSYGHGDDLTVRETPEGTYTSNDVCFYGPRWWTYRQEAERAIVTQKALSMLAVKSDALKPNPRSERN